MPQRRSLATSMFGCGLSSALVVLALAAPAPAVDVEPLDDGSPVATGGGSAGSGRAVMPVVTTWEQVMARQARPVARSRRPGPPGPGAHLPSQPENVSPDPGLVIAARERMIALEQAARDALARGEEPVSIDARKGPAHRDGSAGRPGARNVAQGHVGAIAAARAPAPAPGIGMDPAEPRGTGGAEDPAARSMVDDLLVAHGGPPLAPTGHIDWAGPRDDDVQSGASCAVGASHVGVMVNRRLAFYTKDGTLAVGPVDFEAWWADSPGPRDLFGPKIAYDNHNNRWIMIALDGRRIDETYYAVSVSRTSDPEGAWWTYYLRSDVDGASDTALWADSAGLGFDGGTDANGPGGGAVSITSNQFTAGDVFQHAKLRILYKHELYHGGPVSWWDLWAFSNFDGSPVFGWKPAMSYSNVVAGGNPVLYLLNTSFAGGEWITRWRLIDPLAMPPSLQGPIEIATNAYALPPAARQQGGDTTRLLDTNDCRAQDVQFRNSHLYMACADARDWGTPETLEATVHYWKIVAFTSTVLWDVDYGADNLFYSFPSIKVDVNDDATMVFNRSGLTEFPGVRVTGRRMGEPSTQSSTSIRSGEATYDPTGDVVERWGPSGIGVDCAGDQTGVWSVGQYASAVDAWSTWLGGTSFGQPNVFHLFDQGTPGFVLEDRYYTLELRSVDWAGAIIYMQNGGDTDLAASRTCPFDEPYQNSTFGTEVRDFVVANGTQFGNEFHHVRVRHFGGEPGHRLEVRNDSTDLSVGTIAGDEFAPTEILDLFESNLLAGKTYAAQVIPDAPSADLDVFVFRGSRLSGRRADNDGAAESAGPGEAETAVFTAEESTQYGFAVTNESFADTEYTFKLWLAPVARPISDDFSICTGAYVGSAPELAEGSLPVAWSLVDPPDGMTIDASTGTVSWASPVVGLYAITTRVANPAGFNDTTWFLTIEPFRTGDLDCNDVVDFRDIIEVLREWGGPYEPCPPYKPQDIGQNCDVDFLDILAVLSNWAPGLTDPPPGDAGRGAATGGGVVRSPAARGAAEVARGFEPAAGFGVEPTPGDTLRLELNGDRPVTDHDLLVVEGRAALAGRLEVRLGRGYDPPVGTRFIVIAAGEVTGAFDSIDLPSLRRGMRWELIANRTTVALAVVDGRSRDAERRGMIEPPPADVNGDGRTSVEDVLVLLDGWLDGPEDAPADPALDVDGDGLVGAGDLRRILERLLGGP